MSRTYRMWVDWNSYAFGRFWTWEEQKNLPHEVTQGWKSRFRMVRVKDGKPWNKPCREFKQMKRRNERAQIKHAVKVEKELIPIFRKTDQWDWT